MSDPQLQRRMEQKTGSKRLTTLMIIQDVLQDIEIRAKAKNLERTSPQDYYDAWRDLYQENELAIGIEERRAAGGRDEV